MQNQVNYLQTRAREMVIKQGKFLCLETVVIGPFSERHCNKKNQSTCGASHGLHPFLLDILCFACIASTKYLF